jgi:hypothetical protein
MTTHMWCRMNLNEGNLIDLPWHLLEAFRARALRQVIKWVLQSHSNLSSSPFNFSPVWLPLTPRFIPYCHSNFVAILNACPFIPYPHNYPTTVLHLISSQRLLAHPHHVSHELLTTCVTIRLYPDCPVSSSAPRHDFSPVYCSYLLTTHRARSWQSLPSFMMLDFVMEASALSISIGK